MILSLLLSIPTISFVPAGGPILIGVNNPEQLYNSDLADSTLGNVTVYRERAAPGSYRDWWEHVNRSGATIGYAVIVTNNGPGSIKVTVHGKTQSTGILGGKPFSDLFANYSPVGTTTTLVRKGSVTIFRSDNSVTNGTFFSGVADFDIAGGTALVDNVAYKTYSKIPSLRPEEGYVTRVETDGTHEARVYKGSVNYSNILADNLAFEFNDSSAVGPLNLYSSTYNLSGKTYNTPILKSYWFSNIGPAMNADAIASDMATWLTRGFGQISPFAPSDAENAYPNYGNWGLCYILRGSLINSGSRARTVAFSLQAPSGGGSPIAYYGPNGVWSNTKINAGTSFDYYSISVPAGQTVPFDARYILGGPGAGSLLNRVSLKN